MPQAMGKERVRGDSLPISPTCKPPCPAGMFQGHRLLGAAIRDPTCAVCSTSTWDHRARGERSPSREVGGGGEEHWSWALHACLGAPDQ